MERENTTWLQNNLYRNTEKEVPARLPSVIVRILFMSYKWCLVVCCSPVGSRFSRNYINAGKKQKDKRLAACLPGNSRGALCFVYFDLSTSCVAAQVILCVAVRIVTKDIFQFLWKKKQNKTKQKQIKSTRRSREMFCGFFKGLRAVRTKLNFVSMKVINQA